MAPEAEVLEGAAWKVAVTVGILMLLALEALAYGTTIVLPRVP